MRPFVLIGAMCAAQVLTMAGVFAFPALLPLFFERWALSNTEAGWIAGIYFAGYAMGAPVLLTLTDRIDARRIYLGGTAIAALACAGFAALADGFWSALVLRLAAGVGLAATYMPGLKVLVDRYQGPRQPRAIALYTSSFSFGTAVSYLLAGQIAALLGWRAVFIAAALAALGAAAIVALLPAVRPARPELGAGRVRLFDFMPVIRNRSIRGYVLAYGMHCWELFTLRSWMVAFLAASLAMNGDARFGGIGHDAHAASLMSPTGIATLSGLVAMAASIAGNEACMRFGRRTVIAWIMTASAVCAAGIGFAAGASYTWVAALALLYTALVQLDSGALTAGAVAAADPARRGATMAVHSLVGFGCAGIGPLAFGTLLDLGGRDSALAWGLAFAVPAAAFGLLGPLALRLVAAQR
jgi:MFS family permease